MKNSIPFLAGIFATCATFLPAHFVMNKEAKLRCLESGGSHKIVFGRTFLGDTYMCIHPGNISAPVVSYR